MIHTRLFSVGALALLVAACTTHEVTPFEPMPDVEPLPRSYDLPAGGITKITKETTIQPVDSLNVPMRKSPGDYMEVMERQFRQDLLNTGGQVQMETASLRLTIPTSAVFGANQTAVKSSFETPLKSIADHLLKHKETMIKIVGHVDTTASVQENRQVSLRQANALKNFLQNAGIAKERLLAEGRGSLEPRALNNTATGRGQNNYMEILIYNLQ